MSAIRITMVPYHGRTLVTASRGVNAGSVYIDDPEDIEAKKKARIEALRILAEAEAEDEEISA